MLRTKQVLQSSADFAAFAFQVEAANAGKTASGRSAGKARYTRAADAAAEHCHRRRIVYDKPHLGFLLQVVQRFLQARAREVEGDLLVEYLAYGDSVLGSIFALP
jgi:hypothetical protein